MNRDGNPTLDPAKPGVKPSMIPIRPGAKPAAPQRKSVDTAKYWMNYYRAHDESSADLKDKVTSLNAYKKTQDVQAILTAYLTYHGKNAEPWMYEGLALAIRMNKGSDQDAKVSLGYAADLAEKDQNPNNLVSVADLLFLNGEYARAGTLLDQAAEKVPHRGEPLIMSINVAQRTKDPKRMAASVDRLLSLGWPGLDDRIRADARQQVETLAKTLREEDKGAEADSLLTALGESEARDLYIRLSWVGDADLDLAVEEPLGATARFRTPRTVFGGSIVKNGYGAHPEEVYVCPRAFDGDYTIRIETIYNNPDKPALQATLEVITHEGTAQEHKETHTIALTNDPKPVVANLKGGRRKTALPFLSPTASLPQQSASPKKKGKQDTPKAEKAKSRPKQ